MMHFIVHIDEEVMLGRVRENKEYVKQSTAELEAAQMNMALGNTGDDEEREKQEQEKINEKPDGEKKKSSLLSFFSKHLRNGEGNSNFSDDEERQHEESEDESRHDYDNQSAVCAIM